MQRLIAPEARAGKGQSGTSARPRLLLAWPGARGHAPETSRPWTLERALAFRCVRAGSARRSTGLAERGVARRPARDGDRARWPPACCCPRVPASVAGGHAGDRPRHRARAVHPRPAALREREHRHLLRFACEHRRTGELDSDFGLDNAPSLAFAARASASYPGAFPPARLAEMDALLAARLMWSTRERFLAPTSRTTGRARMNPAEVVLLDGSVLDNKPIPRRGRLYPGPSRLPRGGPAADLHRSACRGASARAPAAMASRAGSRSAQCPSDLPRHQPIHQELCRDQPLLTARSAASGRPSCRAGSGRGARRARHRWCPAGGPSRRRVAPLAVDLDQHAWGRYPLGTTRGGVRWCWKRSISPACSAACAVKARESPGARWLQRVVEAWAAHAGILREHYRIADDVGEDADMPAFARVVIRFGIEYSAAIGFVLYRAQHPLPRPAGRGPLHHRPGRARRGEDAHPRSASTQWRSTTTAPSSMRPPPPRCVPCCSRRPSPLLLTRCRGGRVRDAQRARARRLDRAHRRRLPDRRGQREHGRGGLRRGAGDRAALPPPVVDRLSRLLLLGVILRPALGALALRATGRWRRC